MSALKTVFNTDKRIRLGIWGLGRGMSFYDTCKFLNIDVVAGCDYNEHMRKGFLEHNPEAFATADAEEFLKYDMDAVLVATFCNAHADDCIRVLKAGKHVLSEVTSFHTMAEGVRLVEAVEKYGKVYNLAENYPYSNENMYLAQKWKEGLFGKLSYAEYEYVHECRSLSYTYIDGKPVQPGNSVHSWRSWQSFHYYCTHSLGPVMFITGERPIRVTALPATNSLAGYLRPEDGMGTATPSLIAMSGGGLMRNLMGATTNDTHSQRIWGTLGAAEIGHGLQLRLGGSGDSPMLKVIPSAWGELAKFAQKTGHGGGDFWTLYHFANQIFNGVKAPFDIYSACDVTIPGILAYRSSLENGTPYDVPDFRNKAEREKWRNDNFQQTPYDYKNAVFPKNSDISKTGNFTTIITNLISSALAARAMFDWEKVKKDLESEEYFYEIRNKFLEKLDFVIKTYKQARELADAYPKSDAAKVLNEMLEVGSENIVMAKDFVEDFRKKANNGFSIKEHLISNLLKYTCSVKDMDYPEEKVEFHNATFTGSNAMDMRPVHESKKDGLVYFKLILENKTEGKGFMRVAADGPFRIWVNKKSVASEPDATNPLNPPLYFYKNFSFKKGENEIFAAMYTNHGKAWGIKIIPGLAD